MDLPFWIGYALVIVFVVRVVIWLIKENRKDNETKNHL